MRLTRMALVLAVCLGGFTLTVHASASIAGRLFTAHSRAPLARVANHESPWKSTSHKSGLRRSSEQVKPLLLSPGATICAPMDVADATLDARDFSYQHPDLLPRAPRGPPVLPL